MRICGVFVASFFSVNIERVSLLESLPNSLHLSLHLVENGHASSGDFDVTVSPSIRLWNVSVHAEEAAVRVAGKLALEGDDVLRVQVSGVAGLNILLNFKHGFFEIPLQLVEWVAQQSRTS